MKLGFGLYRKDLTPENFRFARQCGATHMVIHLVDYFKRPESLKAGQPVDDLKGWGVADDKTLWSYEMLVGIKEEIEAAGLRWEAIENFEPAPCHESLLDGPEADRQLWHLTRATHNQHQAARAHLRGGGRGVGGRGGGGMGRTPR